MNIKWAPMLCILVLYFLSGCTSDTQPQSITVDGETKDATNLRINFPLSEEDASKIIEKFCMRDIPGDMRSEFYTGPSEFNGSWWFSEHYADCPCYAKVRINNRDTICHIETYELP